MLHIKLNRKLQDQRRRYAVQQNQVIDRYTGQPRADIRVLMGNLVIDGGGNRALYNPVLDRWERYGAH
jgi:hypothetical protein